MGIHPKNIIPFETTDNKEISNIYHLLNYSFNNLSELKINNKTRNKLLNELIDFYRYHLDGIGNIRSLEVLTQVYQ